MSVNILFEFDSNTTTTRGIELCVVILNLIILQKNNLKNFLSAN